MLHTLITSLRTETKRVEKCTWSTYYEASDEVFAPLMLLQYQGLVRSLHKLYHSFVKCLGLFTFQFRDGEDEISRYFFVFLSTFWLLKLEHLLARFLSKIIFVKRSEVHLILSLIYCQNVNLLYSFCWLFTGIYFITLKTSFYPLLFMPFTHVEAIVKIYLKADNSLAFHG